MNDYQKDPILEELHKIREELAERYQFDARLITEAAKKRQADASLALASMDAVSSRTKASDEHQPSNVQ